MFDDEDDRFEEDLFDDRDIDNDDMIDGFDLGTSQSASSAGQGLA